MEVNLSRLRTSQAKGISKAGWYCERRLRHLSFQHTPTIDHLGTQLYVLPSKQDVYFTARQVAACVVKTILCVLGGVLKFEVWDLQPCQHATDVTNYIVMTFTGQLGNDQLREGLYWSIGEVRQMDKIRTLEGITLAGEQLIQQAIDARRLYQQAVDAGVSADEVKRLRLLADSLFQTVTDYQLDALGHQRQTRH